MKDSSSRKDEFLIIRVPKTLKEKLQKLAAKKGVKLSKYVRDLLSGSNGTEKKA